MRAARARGDIYEAIEGGVLAVIPRWRALSERRGAPGARRVERHVWHRSVNREDRQAPTRREPAAGREQGSVVLPARPRPVGSRPSQPAQPGAPVSTGGSRF